MLGEDTIDLQGHCPVLVFDQDSPVSLSNNGSYPTSVDPTYKCADQQSCVPVRRFHNWHRVHRPALSSRCTPFQHHRAASEVSAPTHSKGPSPPETRPRLETTKFPRHPRWTSHRPLAIEILRQWNARRGASLVVPPTAVSLLARGPIRREHPGCLLGNGQRRLCQLFALSLFSWILRRPGGTSGSRVVATICHVGQQALVTDQRLAACCL